MKTFLLLASVTVFSIGCKTSKATIDPTRDAPVISVEGQMSGEYSCEEYSVKWDSKRPSVWDRVLEGLLMGRLVER